MPFFVPFFSRRFISSAQLYIKQTPIQILIFYSVVFLSSGEPKCPMITSVYFGSAVSMNPNTKAFAFSSVIPALMAKVLAIASASVGFSFVYSMPPFNRPFIAPLMGVSILREEINNTIS